MVIWLLLYAVVLPPVTWVQYLAIMNLKRNRDKLTGPAKAFAYPLLGSGYVCDFLLNTTHGSLVFVELPRWYRGELLLTGRCTRHLGAPGGWRWDVAQWLCRHYMNAYDPDPDGIHCN